MIDRCRDFSEVWPGRRWWPARPPRCPTGFRAGKPTARPPQDDQAYYEQQPQYAQPHPHRRRPAVDPITQLKELAELHSQGILTDTEFEAENAKILNA